MPCCVLDASAALPWLFADAASPETDALLALVVRQGAAVPSLRFFECATALASAEKRGRIGAEGRAEAVELLGRLPLTVVANEGVPGISALVALARAHGLTASDAAYLAAVPRTGLPLASGDKALRRAAALARVALHGDAG